MIHSPISDHRKNAEDALQSLNGTTIGKQTVRLSWGRTPANKQVRFFKHKIDLICCTKDILGCLILLLGPDQSLSSPFFLRTCNLISAMHAVMSCCLNDGLGC